MSSFHSRHRQLGGRGFHVGRNETDLSHSCLLAMPLWHTVFMTCEQEHLTASTRHLATRLFLLPHPPPWTARAHLGFFFAMMGFPLCRLALIAICVNALMLLLELPKTARILKNRRSWVCDHRGHSCCSMEMVLSLQSTTRRLQVCLRWWNGCRTGLSSYPSVTATQKSVLADKTDVKRKH